MEQRHVIYNRQLEEVARQEAAGAILVIRPAASIPVSRTEKDPRKLQTAYEIGRSAAEGKLPEIERFLSVSGTC